MPLCQKWGPPRSPAVALHLIQMMTCGSSWHHCTLRLQDSLNLCGSWLRLFINHSNYPVLHSFISFSLLSMSREICHSSMGYKLLDYFAHSWQRNFNISGDWLVTLRLLIFFSQFCSLSLGSFFSLLQAWCGTHRHTTQKLSQLLYTLSGISFYFHIASTCYLPQVSLNEDHMLEMKLFTRFNRVPMILSSQFLEFCVKLCQI